MNKIGIDARLLAYRDGGISTYIRSLAQAFSDDEGPLNITLFAHRKAAERITPNLAEKKLITPPHNRFEQIALSIELLPHQLDVFHSPDFIPPLRGAKRHVITVHDLTFLHYPQYLTANARRYYNDKIDWACHHADHILAVSSSARDDLMTLLNIPESKITVQPHGVDPRFRPLSKEACHPVQEALHLPDDYILHVGTYEPRKNIIGLLTAYKALLAQMPDAPPVVLVGRPGWLFEETQTQIAALDIDEHILWRMNVTDEQLPAVYNLARVLAAPSFYEGFGLPLLEAMACGTVPIASDRSAFPEVMGDVGLRFDPEDSDAIAEALRIALTDDAWYQDMCQRAIQRASSYTWANSAEIARRVYTSLL
ncbi:glycosyltransferase family 4 protein [Phototrophicus methaneseepsis]|uniref:Glycosyltransferase family 4 protein n=1 Tax=Phototrophicus methaneseepsis TaxID=2710758 RepID=A0A7S8ICY6_9CHLR|nr:glycosyltransferase family 1 protein [Phototrophicus methaneseepsis]QPC80804.1 glycosyltransferase family 4 protein [Phototrophicus methaneseepsis]